MNLIRLITICVFASTTLWAQTPLDIHNALVAAATVNPPSIATNPAPATVPPAGTLAPLPATTSVNLPSSTNAPTVGDLMIVLDDLKVRLQEQQLITARFAPIVPLLVVVTNVASSTNVTYAVTTNTVITTNAIAVVTMTTNVTYKLPSTTSAAVQTSATQPVTIPAVPAKKGTGTRTKMKYGNVEGNVEINIGGVYGKVEGQLPRPRSLP